MRTDFGTRRIKITRSREPKSTCSKDSFFHHMLLVSGALLQLSTINVFAVLDTLEILTRNWTLLNFHQVSVFKPLGMVSLSSLEDSQLVRWEIPMLFQTLLYLIKNPLLLFQMQVTPASWCARPFAHIWVASQCHILVLTRVGYACVMDQSMINSVE